MKKLFIVFAALCLAAPAMAADWNFYGSARFGTFYIDDDPDLAGADSETNLLWAQQGNSRIGANVKFNDEIGGRFEMSDSFGKRILYGTYNFGGRELLIGQTYTPTSTYFYSNQVFGGDNDLLQGGQFYAGRNPMVQLKMGGLKLAAVTQKTDAIGGGTVETMLPKLEASYGFRADQFYVDVFGGYQTYEEKGTAAGDVDVDSYVVGIGGGVNFGPIYFNAGVHMGQNYGNYGGGGQSAAIVGTDLRDVDNFGYLAVIGFKASDMLNLEAGYGYEENELDAPGQEANEIEQMYLQATVNITKGFFVVPEIGLRNFKTGGQPNEPETFYVGAKWQINF